MPIKRRSGWIPCAIIVAAGVGLATAGLAQSLPRLPKDFPFSQGAGSPGQVTFSHLTHVDQKRPDCTGCHPALFKLLQKATPAEARTIDHSSMEAGRHCGACHNGKAAFGLENCPVCHQGG
jgi:c(7)-type cytochrome triheme protein